MRLTFIIERTNTGFSAYVEEDDYAIATTGDTLSELKKNMREATELHFEEQPENLYDLSSFLEQFPYIKAEALSKRIGMNASLLRQYATGQKMPAEKQAEKIINELRKIGQELSAI
jgi:predicted RNase H-like HicB family nuclease